MTLEPLPARPASPLLRTEVARVRGELYHVRAAPTAEGASFWVTRLALALGGGEAGEAGDSGSAQAAGRAAGGPRGLVAGEPQATGLRVQGYQEHAVCPLCGGILLAVVTGEKALSFFVLGLREGSPPEVRKVACGWNYVTACEGFALAELGGGRVMLAGGYRRDFLQACTRFNVRTGEKEAAPLLERAVAGASLYRLFPAGEVSDVAPDGAPDGALGGAPASLRDELLLFGGCGPEGFRPYYSLTTGRGARWSGPLELPCAGPAGVDPRGDWASCWVCGGMVAAARLGKAGAVFVGYYRREASLLGLEDGFVFCWEHVASTDLSALSPECVCTYEAGQLVFSGGEGEGPAEGRRGVYAFPLARCLPEGGEARRVLAGGYYSGPAGPEGGTGPAEPAEPVSTKEALEIVDGAPAGRAGAEGAQRAAPASDPAVLKSVLARLGRVEGDVLAQRREVAEARRRADDALERCAALEREKGELAARVAALEGELARIPGEGGFPGSGAGPEGVLEVRENLGESAKPAAPPASAGGAPQAASAGPANPAVPAAPASALPETRPAPPPGDPAAPGHGALLLAALRAQGARLALLEEAVRALAGCVDPPGAQGPRAGLAGAIRSLLG